MEETTLYNSKQKYKIQQAYMYIITNISYSITLPK